MKPTPSSHTSAFAAFSPFSSPAVRPSERESRSRTIHWLAWTAALLSVIVAIFWSWTNPQPRTAVLLQSVDVTLGLFFAAEFFTRTGWQLSRLTYLKWRWFDVVAVIPITVLGPVAIPAFFWFIFVCRGIRLIDRTLGDGYVQRHLFALAGIFEEEISDRVLVKMLTRWERELDGANFGTAMAQALARNKDAVLARVYAEQLQDGPFAKVAHFMGLQGALEKEEQRLFAALIEMVGSREVDAAIRDVVGSSLRRSREQLGARDWRRKVGVDMARETSVTPPVTASIA